MEQNKRLKLCPHCEGRIEIDAVSCAYCGRNISEKVRYDEIYNEEPRNFSGNDSLSSLYPPPYRPKVFDEEEETQFEEENEEEIEDISQEESEPASNDYVWSTVLLSVGINLLLLSLFMIFFSKDGQILLQWNAKYWFLYFLLAVPFIYYGYKRLSRVD